MTPRIQAILTILIIGLISFLIGWLLTSSKWKRKHKDLKSRFDALDRSQESLKKEYTEINEKYKEVEKTESSYKKEQKQMLQEIKLLKKEKSQLAIDNQNLKWDIEEKKGKTGDWEELKKLKALYTKENHERLRLEGENLALRNKLSEIS